MPAAPSARGGSPRLETKTSILLALSWLGLGAGNLEHGLEHDKTSLGATDASASGNAVSLAFSTIGDEVKVELTRLLVLAELKNRLRPWNVCIKSQVGYV